MVMPDRHGSAAPSRAPSACWESPDAHRAQCTARARRRVAADRARPARIPPGRAGSRARRCAARRPRDPPRPAPPWSSRYAPTASVGTATRRGKLELERCGAASEPQRRARRSAITRTTGSSAGRAIGRSWCRKPSATSASRASRLLGLGQHRLAAHIAGGRHERGAEIREQQMVQRAVGQHQPELAQAPARSEGASGACGHARRRARSGARCRAAPRPRAATSCASARA